MAWLRKRRRHGKLRYFIRARSGSELSAGGNLETAKELWAHYDRLERLERAGAPLPPSRSTWTLKKLSEWDLARRKSGSLERRWNRILEALGPDRAIESISAGTIGDAQRLWLETAGPATVNRNCSVLRAALARARAESSGSGYRGDPFATVPPLDERPGRKKPVSLPPKVVQRAISFAWRLARKAPWHVRPGEWAQNAAIVELIYLTASRSSQVLELRRSQVRRQAGVRVLVFPPHKGGLERLFVMEGRIEAILDGLPGGSEWFFPSARSDGPRDNLRKFWQEVCRRAKLPAGTTLHSLRHSASSAAFSRGSLIPDVQALLGHASPAMAVRLYTQLFPALIRPLDVAHLSPTRKRQGGRKRAVSRGGHS